VELDGRTVSGGYRFGYQGSEKDDEVKGNGNFSDFGARFLDPRLGRWHSLDVMSKTYLTPNNFCSNNPLIFYDPDGNTDYYSLKGKKIGSDGIENGLIGVVHDKKIARQINKTGDLSKITNIENGAKFRGGFIIHQDILSKSVDILEESIVKGQDRELSTSMDKSPEGKGYIATSTIVGEANEKERETVSMNQGEISIHSHPLRLKRISKYEVSGSSTRPSTHVDGDINDAKMFQQHKMNIIVGNSIEPKTIPGSQKIDQGELEIKVYGTNYDDVRGRISLKTAGKIIKNFTKTN
jgi:RHS repeat-associated protein